MPYKDPEKLRAYRLRDLAKQREKRQENPDLARARDRAKYARNQAAEITRKRSYRAVNREAYRDYSRQGYRRNRERILAQLKTMRTVHRERLQRWRHAHPDQAQNQVRRYRAKKAQVPINDLTGAQWQEIKAAYGHRCVYCHRKMQRLSQDHITPISKGGNHTASNVVPACISCNSSKNDGDVLSPVQPVLLTIAPSGINMKGKKQQ